ncbi:uncharacterized protein LOC109854407 [Pseudomyrmex gracilis]|uniref:uncharacterized protein LOC109854407 n=1 Tax=Pseudomyrmex gracilis TaxID=219809 RepID=UPI000995AF1B|nr:uncharacterized protein LOC109854407 [Pseudomyrmex gracilis]
MDQIESTGLVTVASYRRRHHLAEEVPGLYIRRLTLEDPRRREPSGSRSQSPARHICHPRSGYAPLARGSSSYRSWIERLRKENPAFLTIVSLELPESPIPLIESQANARWRRVDSGEITNDRDDILDEFLEKVTEVGKGSARESRASEKYDVSRKNRRDNKKHEPLECTKMVATLEECTRNIIEGPKREGSAGIDADDDCICSEISKSLRINIRRRTEVMARIPSPEVTHNVRIATKCRDRLRCEIANDENLEEEDEERAEEDERRVTKNDGNKKDLQSRRESARCDASRRVASATNTALDFTLNCNSVRLTSRDTSLKTRSEK